MISVADKIREEGEREGIKKGERMKAIEAAKKLLTRPIYTQLVGDVTGLSMEDVEKLARGEKVDVEETKTVVTVAGLEESNKVFYQGVEFGKLKMQIEIMHRLKDAGCNNVDIFKYTGVRMKEKKINNKEELATNKTDKEKLKDAIALYRQELYQEAADVLEAMLETEVTRPLDLKTRDEAQLFFYLGHSYYHLGQNELAINCYKQSIYILLNEEHE